MAIVTSSQNITSVSYAAGEIIEIRNGATLTISATPSTRPGTIQCITSGKLRIENSSTTVPIVVALEDMNRDFRFEGNGVMEVRGAMMELGTGTGSAQTFDFSTLYSGALTDVTYVEVEQTAGSGNYIPWHIVEVASRYYNIGRVSDRGSITTEYDGNQPVLFFNSDTRVLSSGNGTNGLPVPSGCKIRIPNILITNQDWQPDASLVHRIASEGVPTAGTFTITITNARTGAVLGTTSAIAFNADAATIDTAVEAVTGAGTITAGGGPLPAAVSLTLAGSLASTPVRMQVNSSVTGGTNPIIYSLENSAASLTLLDLNPSGTLDAESCMFSRKVRQANSSFSSFRAVKVGFGGDTLSLTASNGNVTLDHTNFTPNPYVIHAASSISSVFGTVFRRKNTNTSGFAQTTFSIQTLPNLTKEEDTWHLQYGSRTSTAACLSYITLPNVDIVRPRCVGGRMQFTNLVGNTVFQPSGADHPGTAQLTTNAQAQFLFTNCFDMVIAQPSKAGTAAARTYPFVIDAQSKNISVFGGSYDCSGNSAGPVQPNGVGLFMKGFNCSNLRASGVIHDLPASFAAAQSELRKVFVTQSSGDSAFDSCQSSVFDLAGCSPSGFNEVNASVENFVGGNFADLGLTPTTGHVTFGAFGRGTSLVLTGAAFTDQLGSIFLPSNGDTAVATMPFSMHGITGFQNVNQQDVAELEGGFSDVWRIINDGGVTGGTFTLTFYDSSNVLIGTTGTIAFNATTTVVDTAIEAVLGASTVTVTGALSTGYIITRAGGTIIRCTADGSLLTGGTKPNIANALSRHNIGVALGTALNSNTALGSGLTVEFGMKTPSGSWSAYQTLNQANLISGFAALTGYSANDGLDMRLRFTAVGNDEYRRIQQVSILTNINPSAWILGDATVTFAGPEATDVIKVRRVSDMSVLYTFTGSGVKEFTVGSNYGVEVCVDREDSGGTVLMRTNPTTFLLKFGNNGTINLFYGSQVQLAQSADVTAIKAAVDLYLDAAISSRLSEANSLSRHNTLVTEINANETKIDIVDTVVDAIKLKTDNLPNDPADASDISGLIDALPTASENASAVRTELTTELARVDVAISTRLATSGYTAPANSDISAIKAKTDNLPTDPADESSIQAAIAAIPTAPSASTVASAVRTELTTELGRIDVATSTRLASASYTSPPSVSAIRTEIDTNSTKLDVAVSTRASQSSLDTVDGIVDSIVVDTGTDIPALISGLNDLSAAEVNAEVDTALADYDAPTKAEMDTSLNAIKKNTDLIPGAL